MPTGFTTAPAPWRKARLAALSVSFASLMTSGCASFGISLPEFAGAEPVVTPSQPASAKVPARWGDGLALNAAEIPAERAPIAINWLSGVGGQSLLTLSTEALAANPDITSAAARLKIAELGVRLERGGQQPQVEGGASVSGSSIGFQAGGDFERDSDVGFGLSLGASWEPDLWGRLAAGLDAAGADLAAAEADLNGARLSLVASVAQQWVQLSAAEQRLALAEAERATRERALTLTERRFRSGLADSLAVRLSRSTLASSEAQIAAQKQRLDSLSRGLEARLGRYPAGLIRAETSLPTLQDITLDGTPSDLLTRRPDIVASEARVRAAGLRVEEARAAMLPRLALTASASTSDDTLVDIFDPRLIAARLVSNLTAPLFDGGTRQTRADIALAQAELALAAYASDLLGAWTEVESALAADGLLLAQERALQTALIEAIEAEKLAERQFGGGLASIFDLLDAQARRFSTESSLISVQADRASNRISYHLALGGSIPASTP